MSFLLQMNKFRELYASEVDTGEMLADNFRPVQKICRRKVKVCMPLLNEQHENLQQKSWNVTIGRQEDLYTTCCYSNHVRHSPRDELAKSISHLLFYEIVISIQVRIVWFGFVYHLRIFTRTDYSKEYIHIFNLLKNNWYFQRFGLWKTYCKTHVEIRTSVVLFLVTSKGGRQCGIQ